MRKASHPSRLPKHPQTTEVPEVVQSNSEMPGALGLFGPSWRAFKLNWSSFVIGAIIPIIILALPAFVFTQKFSAYTDDQTATYFAHTTAFFNVLNIVFGLVGIAAALIFYIPYMYLLKLQSAKGIKTTFQANFEHSRKFFWRMLRLVVLRNLVIFVGFLLLIVPGVLLWRRYMMAPFYLIDQDLGVMEAMEKSAEKTKPFAGVLWGMMVIYVAITVLRLVPLISLLVDLLVAVPYSCAQGIRYLQIKKAAA